MLAVMGPSGAGKSTFLDVISRRKCDQVNGKVFLGPKEIQTTAQMSTVGSYVEQEDDLLGVLTVRETITYAARLRYSSICPEPGKVVTKRNENFACLAFRMSHPLESKNALTKSSRL